MTALFYVMLFLFIGLCALLCFVILIQESKSLGLGASFGGDAGDSLFGTSTADVLKKFTAYLAGIFLIVCLILSLWTSSIGRAKKAPLGVNIEEVSGGTMIKDLVYYGSSGLRKKCDEIAEITDEVKQIAQDLVDTVIDKDGAGLAAPQIGYPVRMFVSRYENGADDEGWPILCSPKIYINPKLSAPSSEVDTHGEGCLSIPGIYEEVTRPFSIEVEAMDLEGNLFTETTTGWRARNIMHENDHINGVLFIDRIHPNRRKKIEKALNDIKKIYNK